MEPDSTESVLADLLTRWFERSEHGKDIDLDELCSEHPHLRFRVAELLARDSSIGELLSSLGPAGTRSDPPETPPIERLGEFIIRRALGAGGMAQVYVAEQPSLNREVAVKVLGAQMSVDPVARARFRREAEITAALDHPHIAPIYAIGEENGVVYLAMKLLSGPSLDRLTQRLSPRRAAEVGIAVASALEQAHRAGVVHRDVKPANVVLDGDVPFLLDFGLARVTADHRLTLEGAIPGTLAYMAPEMLRVGGAALDTRSDVYSLGATLYEALGGHPPFREQNPERLLYAILREEPPALRLPGRDRDLETIVARCLEKDPADRVATARDLADDLRRYLDGRPILARRSGFVSRTIKTAKRNRRASAAIAGAMLVILSLGATVAWKSWRNEQVLARRIEAAEAAFRGLRIDVGRAQRDLLEAHALDDARVVALGRLETAALALIDLLDLVQGTGFVIDPARVRRVLEETEAAGSREIDVRLAGFGAAAAHVLLGEHDLARARLLDLVERFGGDRGVTAFLALLDGADVDRALTDATAKQTADPYSHVFAALALRLSDGPQVSVDRELDAALRLDISSALAQYAKAIAHCKRYQYQSARAAFASVLRQGRAGPVMLMTLALQEIHLGDLDSAARHLAEAGDAHPELVAIGRYRLLQAAEDLAGADEILDAALDRWPGDPTIQMLAGERSAARGQFAAAIEHFERARMRVTWPATARTVELALAESRYALEFAAGDLHPIALLQTGVERLAAVVESAELAAEDHDPHVRARALLLASRGRRRLGQIERSWELLDEAVATDANVVSVYVRHAMLTALLLVFAEVDRESGRAQLPDADARRVASSGAAAWRARLSAAKVLQDRTIAARAQPSELELALFAEAILARVMGDDPAARESREKAMALMSGAPAGRDNPFYIVLAREARRSSD